MCSVGQYQWILRSYIIFHLRNNFYYARVLISNTQSQSHVYDHIYMWNIKYVWFHVTDRNLNLYIVCLICPWETLNVWVEWKSYKFLLFLFLYVEKWEFPCNNIANWFPNTHMSICNMVSNILGLAANIVACL